MNWFFTILTVLWTIVFILIFILFSDYFLPDSLTIEIKKSNISSCENPLPKKTNPPSDDVKALNNDDVILLDKDTFPTKLKIQKPSELPDTEDELQRVLTQRMQAVFENRLIDILIRVDDEACVECNRDDKKIILQLKMMRALLDGDIDLAFDYSEELKSYLRKK